VKLKFVEMMEKMMIVVVEKKPTRSAQRGDDLWKRLKLKMNLMMETLEKKKEMKLFEEKNMKNVESERP